MKRIVKLTESDMHRMIKESVYKVLNEMDGNLDIPYYDDPHGSLNGGGIPGRSDKFDISMRRYSKMPKGYDRDIDSNSNAADRIAMMNKSYESEAFPYLKDAENNASWNAYDRELDREGNDMEHRYGSSAEDWLYNESKINRAIRESVNGVLKEYAWQERPTLKLDDDGLVSIYNFIQRDFADRAIDGDYSVLFNNGRHLVHGGGVYGHFDPRSAYRYAKSYGIRDGVMLKITAPLSAIERFRGKYDGDFGIIRDIRQIYNVEQFDRN